MSLGCVGDTNRSALKISRPSIARPFSAFKARGAANAIQTSLSRLQRQDPSFNRSKLCVLTHSSGNHGAALACQAKRAGVQAAVVMPSSESLLPLSRRVMTSVLTQAL